MSGDAAGLDVDLDQAMNGGGGAGIPAGAELIAFAEAAAAAFDHTDAALTSSRNALEAVVGAEGVKEAAATVAVFNGLVRAADATGIELDAGVTAASKDFRSDLGLDDYKGAANTSGLDRPADVAPITEVGALFGD